MLSAEATKNVIVPTRQARPEIPLSSPFGKGVRDGLEEPWRLCARHALSDLFLEWEFQTLLAGFSLGGAENEPKILGPIAGLSFR
jgi:hypothetical protein